MHLSKALLILAIKVLVIRGETLCPEHCACARSSGSLITVDCNDRNLTRLPDVDQAWHDVTQLDAAMNKIIVLSQESFSKLPKLEILYVYRNDISTVDKLTFVHLSQLRKVDLSDNYIMSIDPETFKMNGKLEKLIFSGNSLLQLSKDIPFLIAPSLKYLDLSYCKLTSLTIQNIASLGNLETLNLRSNDLTSLTEETLERLPNIKMIDITNNRWPCGCALKKLLKSIENKREEDDYQMMIPVRCLQDNGSWKTTWTMANVRKKRENQRFAKSEEECNAKPTVQVVTNNPAFFNPVISINTFENITTNQNDLRIEMIFGNLFDFFDNDVVYLSVAFAMFFVFTTTCIGACVLVKCIIRKDSSQQSSNVKQHLELAFKNTDNKSYSKVLLLEPTSPEIRDMNPNDLYGEYLSRRLCPEHISD